MNLSGKIVAACLAGFFSLLCLFGVAAAAEKKGFNLVIRMMAMQDKWFREHIVSPFEKKYGAEVTVTSFDKFWDLEVILKLERESRQRLTGLVKTPLEMTRSLQEFMTPFDDHMSAPELEKLKSQYDARAIALGTIDGKLYYLPRKLETRIMVFLKSKVRDAVKEWKKFEPDIHAALKEDNGYGLPAGYELEKDPNLWDYYDLFVVSYYWANTPYLGIKLPRMAHRGKKYGGTVVGLVDRIFQMGGTSDDALRMSTSPVIDMFMWEAVYKKNGLYNQGMWQDPWSGGGIWNAMKDGKVFLAMMHQIDCFFIHGGTHPELQGFLAIPDDMGVAVMPEGVSFDLDAQGVPLRKGSKKAGTVGWWWGIPRTAPHPGLSVELARWITNSENHMAESRVFGMMPVRRDILDNLQKVFVESWMAEVFEISMRQLALNGDTTPPLLPEYTEVGKIYLEAWYDIIVGNNYGPDGRVERSVIKERLESQYVPKIKTALGNKYPR